MIMTAPKYTNNVESYGQYIKTTNFNKNYFPIDIN